MLKPSCDCIICQKMILGYRYGLNAFLCRRVPKYRQIAILGRRRTIRGDRQSPHLLECITTIQASVSLAERKWWSVWARVVWVWSSNSTSAGATYPAGSLVQQGQCSCLPWPSMPCTNVHLLYSTCTTAHGQCKWPASAQGGFGLPIP